MATDGSVEPRSSGGVQSLSRAFAILEAMADAGGEIGLSQLATNAQLPPATIHRLVRTLVSLGYVRQEPSRQHHDRPAYGTGFVQVPQGMQAARHPQNRWMRMMGD